ncbi:hypothetical protein [Sphingomonas sp. SRS2]|uniref:hypothetical protein n=1 Tax=Sphingomonas sp. SRS2 TaxID=133190 RepID=UPI000618421D|nr:hypothetical protein [Sphingomonas sp. SRS2]KKC24671.1 hypothetical protein WP12_18240 [Sphingomonas sp. SRS2]
MRMFTLLLAAMALAPTAASAAPSTDQRGEARLAQALKGRVAGKPVDCINLRGINSTEIIDGTAILYRSGSRLYVNRPEGGSPLRRDDVLVTKLSDSRLCSIDTVRLLDSSTRFQRGFVSLGKFIPYTKPRD